MVPKTPPINESDVVGPPTQAEYLRVQTARLLEGVETMRRECGPIMQELDPELSTALEHAATSLEVARSILTTKSRRPTGMIEVQPV